MTPAEQQVAERLQAYAGSLRVTHNDVYEAHDRLQQRLGARAHHRTLVAVVAVAASVLLIVGVVALRSGTDRSAPSPIATPSPHGFRAPDGLPPTAARLTGIWRIGGAEPSLLVVFANDGTYAFDDMGRVDHPSSYGTFRVHGRSIVFANLGGYGCARADSWTWLGALPENGRLDAVQTGLAAAGNCHEVPGTSYALTRVSPQSPAGARITGDTAAGVPLTTANDNQLNGIWLQQGTGRLMRFAPEGTYLLDDGGELVTAPDDTGRFVTVGPGRLRLTSAPGSRSCATGDQATWQRVRITSTSLNVSAADDTCQGRADLAGRWVRLT